MKLLYADVTTLCTALSVLTMSDKYFVRAISEKLQTAVALARRSCIVVIVASWRRANDESRKHSILGGI